MGEKELDAVIDSKQTITFGISKEMLAAKDFGALASTIERAKATLKLGRLAWRVGLVFPEFDSDPREVIEIPEVVSWVEALEKRYPFVSVLLEPQGAYKILMMTHVPWKRAKGRGQIEGDPEAVVNFALQSAGLAYRLAKWQVLDARRFTERHLQRLGYGEITDSGLLDAIEKVCNSEGK